MNRRKLDPAIPPFRDWPKVLVLELSSKAAEFASKRIEAMRLYLEGSSHVLIREATGLDRRRVSEIYRRCIAVHADGRIFGERACLPHMHVVKKRRRAPSVGEKQYSQYGHNGELTRLFDRFPHILENLIKAAIDRKSSNYIGSSPRWDKLHRLFVDECRSAGVADNQYPFTVVHQGSRSLAKLLKRRLLNTNANRYINIKYGEDAARLLRNNGEAVRVGNQYQCNEVVQLDAYRIDLLAVLEWIDPKGGLPVIEVIERIWLLVVIECTSRAILGYHLSFNRQYSAEDVLTCIENAIVPWKPMELTVPGLSYPEKSGFPSASIPELAYARFGEIQLDNAWSHTSEWVLEQIVGRVGCRLNFGPVKTPERRIIIERFFRTLAENGYQRMPSTTGSSPRDPRRSKPEERALAYRITVGETMQLTDVMIAQYNAMVHESLYNRTPLQYLEFAVKRNTFFRWYVPESEREDFCLAISRETRVIRGNYKKGQRLHIMFHRVRYYSSRLSESYELRNTEITVECRTRDLRKIKVYLKNGEEFGTLTVAQSWAHHPHDFRMRTAICRIISAGKLIRRDSPDKVGDYLRLLGERAVRNKQSRNQLAHALRKTGENLNNPAPIVPVVAEEKTPPSTPSAPLLSFPAKTINF